MTTQRLHRLRGPRKHFSLLALDHGMTYGKSPETVPLPFVNLLKNCRDHVGGFVANYGVARTLDAWPSDQALVLQCFGSLEGYSRQLTATVMQAVRLDAAAVSVQFAWNDPEISLRMREITAFTSDAHSVGLPVLYMINGSVPGPDLPKLVRVCQEMGADLIKVSCPTEVPSAARATIIESLREAPPVLMAGGRKSEGLIELAQESVSLGFAGYCVGRNIFLSENPLSTTISLNNTFSPTDKGN